MLSSARSLILVLLLAIGILFTTWSKAPSIQSILSPGVDVEIVLSSYREHPDLVSKQILKLRNVLQRYGWSSRVVVYSKDQGLAFEEMGPLRIRLGADGLRKLPNAGREGGTFLNHILSQYDQGYRFPSRHILFAQSLLENEDLLEARIANLRRETAFMSLGRYSKCYCGRDSHGDKKYFPRMREIYSMFTRELCPNTGQLCTYKGQFIVSRKQILQNPKVTYQHLLDILEAPEGHWIYDDPEDIAWEYRGQKSSPSSPFFGHALERSWPVIFNCTNPVIADSCSRDPSSCQCTTLQ